MTDRRTIDAEFEVIHGPLPTRLEEPPELEDRGYIELYPELRLKGWRAWLIDGIELVMLVVGLMALIYVATWLNGMIRLGERLSALAAG